MKKSILIMALAVFIHGANAYADDSASLTGADIMKLSEGQRHWWYAGVFSGFGHVVSTQYDKEKSDCVWNWFFAEPDRRKKQLEEAFTAYPEYLPTSVVAAFLKRDCGVLVEQKTSTPAKE